jgi:hypothetical protein
MYPLMVDSLRAAGDPIMWGKDYGDPVLNGGLAAKVKA